MRRTLLVMSLGLIGAAACKSEDAPKVSASSTTATTAASAAAGRVLEVSGTVTVAQKPLAKGDTVEATAVIETGADGSVAIELLHNLARWELGPNKHVRVDESLAWREPKRSEPVAEVVHDTTSAGRPVERQAATTTVSADFGEDQGGSDAEKHPVVDAKPKPKPKPDPQIKQGGGGGTRGSGGIGLGGIGTIGHGGGTGTGQGYGAGAGKLGGSHQSQTVKIQQGTADVSGALPPDVIRRIVRANFGRLRMCYENGLKSNPTLAGKVVVGFVIDREGNVTNAKAENATISDQGVVSCVVRAFTTFSFPKPEDGVVSVSYPIVFSPE